MVQVTANKGEGQAIVTVNDTKSGQEATIQVTIVQCPDSNHPHIIDLGLPSGTKWACCNVGATTPEKYGGYYAWGETEEKQYYEWDTYIYCDGSQETCYDLGSDIAGTQYDVVHVKWGANWLTPSIDQIKELLDNCTYIWTKKNGVDGVWFTSIKKWWQYFSTCSGLYMG